MLHRMFQRRNGMSDHDASMDWKPGLYYRWIGQRRRTKPWRGPLYFGAPMRARQCASILALLRLIAEANAPMAAGLEAAAIEYRRHMRAWSRGRAMELLRSLVFPAIFLLALFTAAGAYGNAPTPPFIALCVLAAALAALRPFLSGRFDAVLLRLRDDLRAGLQLSEAMRRMDRVFPPGMAERVAAGEATGEFAAVLARLDLECLESLTASRAGGVTRLYVIAVLAAIVAAAGFCLVKVVPVLQEMLREFDQAPPWSLRLLVAAGDHVVYHQHLFAGAATFGLLLLSGIVLPRRGGRLARLGQTLAQTLPPLAFAARPRTLARIAALLATCLRAGMPLPGALEMAATGQACGTYRRALARVRVRIENGAELGAAFDAQKRCFPPAFRLRLRLGAQSGLLPEALDRLAELYHRRAERAAHCMAVIAQACTVLLLGLLVLVVCSACMTTLTTLADAIAMDFGS
jgi:type II secretory pathway component PulF